MKTKYQNGLWMSILAIAFSWAIAHGDYKESLQALFYHIDEYGNRIELGPPSAEAAGAVTICSPTGQAGDTAKCADVIAGVLQTAGGGGGSTSTVGQGTPASPTSPWVFTLTDGLGHTISATFPLATTLTDGAGATMGGSGNPIYANSNNTSSSAATDLVGVQGFVNTNAPTYTNGTYNFLSIDTLGQLRVNTGALNYLVDSVSTNALTGTTKNSGQILVATSSTLAFTIPVNHIAVYAQSYGSSSTSRIHLCYATPCTVATAFGHLVQDQISTPQWFKGIFGQLPIYAISDGLSQSLQYGSWAP